MAGTILMFEWKGERELSATVHPYPFLSVETVCPQPPVLLPCLLCHRDCILTREPFAFVRCFVTVAYAGSECRPSHGDFSFSAWCSRARISGRGVSHDPTGCVQVSSLELTAAPPLHVYCHLLGARVGRTHRSCCVLHICLRFACPARLPLCHSPPTPENAKWWEFLLGWSCCWLFSSSET